MAGDNGSAVSQPAGVQQGRCELLARVFGQILAWRAERLAGTLAGADGDAVVDRHAGPGGVPVEDGQASPLCLIEQ